MTRPEPSERDREVARRIVNDASHAARTDLIAHALAAARRETARRCADLMDRIEPHAGNAIRAEFHLEANDVLR